MCIVVTWNPHLHSHNAIGPRSTSAAPTNAGPGPALSAGRLVQMDTDESCSPTSMAGRSIGVPIVPDGISYMVKTPAHSWSDIPATIRCARTHLTGCSVRTRTTATTSGVAGVGACRSVKRTAIVGSLPRQSKRFAACLIRAKASGASPEFLASTVEQCSMFSPAGHGRIWSDA